MADERTPRNESRDIDARVGALNMAPPELTYNIGGFIPTSIVWEISAEDARSSVFRFIKHALPDIDNISLGYEKQFSPSALVGRIWMSTRCRHIIDGKANDDTILSGQVIYRKDEAFRTFEARYGLMAKQREYLERLRERKYIGKPSNDVRRSLDLVKWEGGDRRDRRDLITSVFDIEAVLGAIFDYNSYEFCRKQNKSINSLDRKTGIKITQIFKINKDHQAVIDSQTGTNKLLGFRIEKFYLNPVGSKYPAEFDGMLFKGVHKL